MACCVCAVVNAPQSSTAASLRRRGGWAIGGSGSRGVRLPTLVPSSACAVNRDLSCDAQGCSEPDKLPRAQPNGPAVDDGRDGLGVAIGPLHGEVDTPAPRMDGDDVHAVWLAHSPDVRQALPSEGAHRQRYDNFVVGLPSLGCILR